jgi:hypothetical protein
MESQGQAVGVTQRRPLVAQCDFRLSGLPQSLLPRPPFIGHPRRGPPSTALCPGELAFSRDALMLFVGALDAIFELPAVMRELPGHFVVPGRHIATDCGSNRHSLADPEFMRGHRARQPHDGCKVTERLWEVSEILEAVRRECEAPPRLGWPCSSGGSVAGSPCSSSADQSGAILIATANRAGSPCDATGPRLPASPAPSRARPAARSDIATPIGAGLRSRAEADLSVAASGRPLDAEARQPQVPGRRGYEHGRRAGKPGPKNRDHAHDGMAATQKSLGFLRDSEF